MSHLVFAEELIGTLRAIRTRSELASLMENAARELGFRYYALIDHDDLRTARADRVDLKDYPAAIADRLIAQCRYPAISSYVRA